MGSQSPDSPLMFCYIKGLQSRQSLNDDPTIELRSDDLLSVTSQDASTWCKVVRIVYKRSHNQWYVRCVNRACLQEVRTTVSEKNNVGQHIRILVNRVSVLERTNLGYASCELKLVTVSLNRETRNGFKNGCNVRRTNDEVCATPKG